MLKKLLSVSVLMAFAGGYTQVQGKGNPLPSKGISLVSSEGMSNKSGIALPVTGKITSSDGEALPGVTIKIKGTARGTITGGDGSFKLDVPDGNSVLVISSTGFETQEVTVGSRSVINVVLANDIKSLEEVVVVGYGERKKSDVTGAMVSVGSAELNQRPVANALQGMQGRAAGVDITSNERPGQVGKITIRGVRSLSASNEPLYVVDGIPLTTGVVENGQFKNVATRSDGVQTGGIDNLNPNDIESVDVLKDASATAIYGSRGANGVVIITTKKGKNGKYTLSLNSTFTSENINNSAQLMNASEYIDYRRWSYFYKSTPTLAYPRGDQPTQANDKLIFKGDSDPSAWANIMKGWASGTWDGSKVETTDWIGMVTRPSLTGQHTISVSGGTEKMKAYASFGFLDNQGTVKAQGYKRYTGKLSVDVKPLSWFSMGGVLNTSYSVNEFGQSALVGSNIASSLYESSRRLFSYAVPYDANGVRILQPGNDPLVYTIVDEEKYSQDQRVNLRLFGSFYSELNFGAFSKALDGLKFRVNFGPDVSFNRNGIFLDGNSVTRTGTSYASLSKDQFVSYTLDNMLTYNKTINNKHQIGITALQTQTEYGFESNRMAADNVPFSSQKWNALNITLAQGGWASTLTEKQLRSYMGRINYDYDNRFLLTVSGRFDGASQLAEGNKWAFFPSTALGWRLNNEKFLAEQTWIDALKLRAGVGVTGNAAIDPYATQGGLPPIYYAAGGSLSSGVANNTVLANQNLTWEKTTQFNYGVDFSLFKRNIMGSLDYYTSHTSDLLMLMSIPSTTGFANTYSNVGETASRGVDLTLTSVNLNKRGFEWSTTFNGSWQDNEIVTLSKGKVDDINNKWFIGQSQGVIYDYQSNGLWKDADAAEMAKFNANGSTFTVGSVRPVDQNGDYKIDPNNDRKVLGSTIPRFIVGLTNNFEYKGISLSVMLYGRLGYLYNTGGEALSGRSTQRVVSYYTPNNTNSDYQRPFYSEGAGDVYSPTLGYKDGSFIKVRNISLGYKLPESLNKSLGLSNSRIFFQAQNLGMLYNNIKWIDMDLQSSAWNRGYTFGINVDF
ncbi:TonB-linked SusC/RagA family outer membrane protein [Arcicella aurantiaca]|uniref:TonB-linked SusC/RagA family outer membrane protein n=1 Tax=Arcicella aurantiaca TaxID=591202 RepID=A0A316E2M8_9BACT|nr:TonB-dependent receptor [Arcicella aurantiaca]PWK23812.1 TonB-linked SusC/RagA family outer membrane protein [Arcicella aurantiaca]